MLLSKLKYIIILGGIDSTQVNVYKHQIFYGVKYSIDFTLAYIEKGNPCYKGNLPIYYQLSIFSGKQHYLNKLYRNLDNIFRIPLAIM